MKQELASDLSIDMYHDAALTETRSFFDEVHYADFTVTMPADETVAEYGGGISHQTDLTYNSSVHYTNITTTMPVR